MEEHTGRDVGMGGRTSISLPSIHGVNGLRDAVLIPFPSLRCSNVSFLADGRRVVSILSNKLCKQVLRGCSGVQCVAGREVHENKEIGGKEPCQNRRHSSAASPIRAPSDLQSSPMYRTDNISSRKNNVFEGCGMTADSRKNNYFGAAGRCGMVEIKLIIFNSFRGYERADCPCGNMRETIK
eukprot:62450-Pelagomonas_calceolata.AAC.2